MPYRPTLEPLESRTCPATIAQVRTDLAHLLADAATNRPAQVRQELAKVQGEITNTFGSNRFPNFAVAPAPTGFGSDLTADFNLTASTFTKAVADASGKLTATTRKRVAAEVNTVRAERAQLNTLLAKVVNATLAHRVIPAPARPVFHASADPVFAITAQTDAVVTWVSMPTEQVANMILPARTADLGHWTPADGSDLTYVWLATNMDVAPNTDAPPPEAPPVLSTTDGTGTNGVTAAGPCTGLIPTVVYLADSTGYTLTITGATATPLTYLPDGSYVYGPTWTWYNPDVPH